MIKYKKGIYWHDWVEDDDATIDLETQVLRPLKDNEINFEEIESTDRFNLFNPASYFDALFFDYGGVGLGNSCLESFCRYIYEDAENHPSRYYVMVSRFTTEAMKDIKEENNKKLANVFDCMDDFIKFSIEMNKESA